MIDTIQKLPDSFIGITLTSVLWFGFNYTVLADRAMDSVIKQNILPACLKDLKRAENKPALLRLPSEILPSSPELNLQGLFRQFQNSFRLSPSQRLVLCQCASTRTAQSIKFDYAVHTASLRFVTPESVRRMRNKTLSIIQSERCGALPWSNFKG